MPRMTLQRIDQIIEEVLAERAEHILDTFVEPCDRALDGLEDMREDIERREAHEVTLNAIREVVKVPDA